MCCRCSTSRPHNSAAWKALSIISHRTPHDDYEIEACDVARYGGAGVPPWSQAWGRDSSESAWWLGCSSRDPAGPSPNERRKTIPQWPTTCRGNREGPVQRGLGGGRR
ncbi:hypothetical protein CHARACLAT_032472 [Characodon lateralis]|uniref:Uncharacterized protein n=1 Tax=Characodon lateralis TaxID=208331 RepID=A0ABU7DXQ6_9TELE|nr:hypothetical protein [Characodon lateralis]